MNTGRLSVICWALFLVALIGIGLAAQASPEIAIAAAAISALSFVYAMYLCLWGMRTGDPRLLRRGTSGAAEVVSARETTWAVAAGEYYGIGAPAVWKYGLEVA